MWQLCTKADRVTLVGCVNACCRVQPDVVSTKDGVLVCRHDILLDDSTDVAQHPEFAHLYTTKVRTCTRHQCSHHRLDVLLVSQRATGEGCCG